jgi:hypothetical protein
MYWLCFELNIVADNFGEWAFWVHKSNKKLSFFDQTGMCLSISIGGLGFDVGECIVASIGRADGEDVIGEVFEGEGGYNSPFVLCI